MLKKLIIGLSAASFALSIHSGIAMADKADSSLTWATTREIPAAIPYYENVREMTIIGMNVWDGLLYRNPKTFEYEPLLAESYKWADNKTLEFKIRKGVKFHDGTNLGPDDVVATYNHVAAEDSGVLTRRNVSWIDHAEKVNDDTVLVHLKETFPSALEFVATVLPILPASIWDTAKVGAQGKPDYATIKPIGSGPYKITGFTPGVSVVMEKFADYWKGSPKGSPTIKKVTYRTVSDPEAQIAEVLSGSVDLIWDVSREKAEQIDQASLAKVVSSATMRINYINMDRAGRTGKGKENPFFDKRVRQAVAHAINRDLIAKELVGGASAKIHSACFPTQFGCTEDVIKYEFNPEKAKKMLADAGYPNGFTTDIYAYRDRPVTEAVMGYLAEVGIKTNLKYMQYKAFRENVWNDTAGFHEGTWGSYSVNDVSASTSAFFKGGRDDYCQDDEIKSWLETGDTSVDPAARKAAYKKALSKIASEACWLPMFAYSRYYVFNKDLDFTPAPDGFAEFYATKWK